MAIDVRPLTAAIGAEVGDVDLADVSGTDFDDLRKAFLDHKVLVFRESRGWEVRHPFFTDQFRDAGLTGELALDRNIDGISGATLSVRALSRLARLALYLHTVIPAGDDAP